MGCFKALDQLFHVMFRYHKPIKCFVFSIWLAKSPNVSSNYAVNILIKGENKSLCFDGIKVSSVEDFSSIDKCKEQNGNHFLCLPVDLAKNISIRERLVTTFSFKKI